MEKLQSPKNILDNWIIDGSINKQLLCYEIRRRNTIPNHFILDYDSADYSFHTSQTTVKDTVDNIIRLKTYLNKNKELVDLVNRFAEIEFDIDLAEEKLLFRLELFFHRNANNEELRRKKAIVLETYSYEEFRDLLLYIGYGNFEKDTSFDHLGYFTKIFEYYFNQASTVEQLLFLYTNTPDFVFERMTLENEKVMQHLLTIIEYDDTEFWSGWKDGSSALVNVLRAFSSHIYLLEKFKKEPELCNRIYYNLDGVSYIDGKPQSNRLIFANILQQYCLFSKNRPKEGAPTFRVGNDFKIGTEVTGLSGAWLGFGQSNSETFFLQQQKEITQRVTIAAKEQDANATEVVTENLEEGKQYFPLEMVYFVNENEKNIDPETGELLPPTTMLVPAIYVKAMADAQKWEEINYFIRITTDIIGVVLGIVTLATTGNPYLILAAMADLTLAGIDLTIQVLREEILKLPGGEQFLKDWDLIYGVGGPLIAAPQLVVSVYRGIFILLPRAVKNVQQGLRTMAISLFLDLNSGAFQRQNLRLFQQTEWVVPSAGFFSKTVECDALIQNGAFFIELDAAAIMESINKGSGINPDIIGAISPSRKFALVYKGEIVAQGGRYDKAYQKTLMDLKRASYNVGKVGEILEELHGLKHLPDNVLEHASLGEFASPGNPKKSTLPGKMKSGGHGQENVDYLNKIGRKYKIEHNYKNGVRIGAVDGHDDKYKRITENVHITGQSWFPKSWTKEKIKEAGKFIIEKNYIDFKALKDGIPIFDNFDGVRVGVMKTNGKPKTIFPDNTKQPFLNSKNFESNPYKK